MGILSVPVARTVATLKRKTRLVRRVFSRASTLVLSDQLKSCGLSLPELGIKLSRGLFRGLAGLLVAVAWVGVRRGGIGGNLLLSRKEPQHGRLACHQLAADPDGLQLDHSTVRQADTLNHVSCNGCCMSW